MKKRIFDGRGIWDGRLITFDSLPSTNQWALDNASTCRNGDVVRAITQTAGRGRFQRKWVSAANRCLTVSIIIQPEMVGDFVICTITQTAALAVRSTLAKHSIGALVKWPNDVLVNGRKIAGILAERETQSGALILGIGLNVNLTREDLANVELSQPATSMTIEEGKIFDTKRVLGELLEETEKTIDIVATEGGVYLLNAWARYDFLADKRIEVQTNKSKIQGKYAGLDHNGRLKLIDSSGQELLFWTGDVSLKKDTPTD